MTIKGVTREGALNLLVAILASVLSLCAADGLLRLLQLVAPRRGSLTPRPAPHRLKSRIVVFSPGYSGVLTSRDFRVSIQANSLGFREREFDTEAMAQRHPVLFVGDSYFFGWGVELRERVSERFGTLLAEGGWDVPVVNYSFPGLGTHDYLEVLREFTSVLEPRLIILGFFVGNDFLDDLNYRTSHRNESPGVESVNGSQSMLFRPNAMVRELLRSSPLVNLANQALWTSPSYRRLFSALELRNDRIALYERANSDAQRRLYAPTLEAFQSISDFSRENNIPVLVAIIPDHLQVLEPKVLAGYDFNRPQRVLLEQFDKTGLLHLDLLPMFAAPLDPQQLFFREDKHWTREGHAFVARALLQRVLEDPQILNHPAGTRSLRR